MGNRTEKDRESSKPLHFPAGLHDRSLVGWGIRRRRGDLGGPTDPDDADADLQRSKIGEKSQEISPATGLAGRTGIEEETAVVIEADDPLGALATRVASCQECSLCQTRNRTVFGVGNPHARLMFVGEAPGAEEDRRGEPFVGRAGQLLDKIITQGLKLTRKEVYITNVLKCRPPENRDPQPDEVERCRSYLEAQIDFVKPQILVALGRPAAMFLTGQESSLKQLRGGKHEFRGIPVVVTYHPAFLLRQPQYKAHCWHDLQSVIGTLGESE